jgi:SnoaL-like domain
MSLTAAQKRALIQQYIDAYNDFDIDGMLGNAHAEVEFADISGGVVNVSTKGIDELRQLAETSKTLFSERHQEILAFEAGEDTASISVAFRAVLASDLPGGKKKGEHLKLTGRSEFRFRGGLIDRITDIS